MSQPTAVGSQYLQRLIRQAAGDASVAAAAVGGALAAGVPDPFPELELYLVAPGGLDLAAWLSPVGETAFLTAGSAAATAVTSDGLTVQVQLVDALPPALQVVFDRTGAQVQEPPAPVMPDLAAAAGRFWYDLYLAGAALGRSQPLAAHCRLERCRTALVDLYRLALAPGRPGAGWEGADTLPGAAKLLDGVRDWLVSPLDVRVQWRCAMKLATAYESLLLPLAERLGLPYPWAMRKLAFDRLDQIRPDRPDPAGMPVKPELPPEAPPAPSGPAKFRIKRRGSGE